MLYTAYHLQSELTEPLRRFARAAQDVLAVFHKAAGIGGLRPLSAGFEMLSRAHFSHTRPPFGIASTTVDGHVVPVREVVAHTTPFATLLHFQKEVDLVQPRVLVVAPMSGHFATLLRGTVQTLLPEHDVYITDWHNARDVPLAAGRFGIDEYVDHLIAFFAAMGPGAHVIAVCQPCIQVLAAVALMSEDKHPAVPRSMTLMAGPIDARVNPTEVNVLASSRPVEWFEQNLVAPVPAGLAGEGRKVYPGFVQLCAFMSMNRERHQKSHRDLYRHLVMGEHEQAETIKSFYDEYFAVADLPAEFYLETVAHVFQGALLAKGELTVHGRRVNTAAIKKTALLTVEGERDDICALGQTVAAHDLCTGLKGYMKRHHMQPGVGHYGVFSGKRWETQIYPMVRSLMLSMS